MTRYFVAVDWMTMSITIASTTQDINVGIQTN